MKRHKPINDSNKKYTICYIPHYETRGVRLSLIFITSEEDDDNPMRQLRYNLRSLRINPTES